MSQVLEALKDLDNSQRRRIINWLSARFGLVEGIVIPPQAPVRRESAQPGAPTTVAKAPAGEKSGASEAVREQKQDMKAAVAPDVSKTASIEKIIEDLRRYKNIETLFLSADVKTIASKILLAAAYLQEIMDFKEMSSFDINSRLKKLGYRISNISTALSELLRKQPPLLIQTTSLNESPMKRRFRITDEGIRIARAYLKE
ncbi:MAG: hypothetical protein ACM3SY_01375 [Candidatus Omnitrophota bacterium]